MSDAEEDDEYDASAVEADGEPMPLACLPTASLAALLRGRGMRIDRTDRHYLVRTPSASGSACRRAARGSGSVSSAAAVLASHPTHRL